MPQKQWVMKRHRRDAVLEICNRFSVSEPVAGLLLSRGMRTPDQVGAFFSKSVSLLFDPFLLKDMDKAVRRIGRALEASERIVIYGDYDVDGLTAAAVLYKCLSEKSKYVDIYIPSRDEGYGINCAALDELAKRGTKLLITVDCGITAVSEAQYCKELGIDLVITDHHECGESLPGAVAVVNPKRDDCTYPFKGLAGVGVAFKLACALEGGKIEESIQRYSDLVCVGTIADIMPLVSENRVLVSYGLKRLEETENVGLRALISACGLAGKSLSSSSVAFALAPRINACGRMGSAMTAERLLLTPDYNEAARLASFLCEENAARQDAESLILQQALDLLSSEGEIPSKTVIVLAKENWNHGVLGIVASRLTEIFYLPVVLLSIEGDCCKGSCRSIAGFNIFDALNFSSHLLQRFGGHEMAAGLSLETKNIGPLRKALHDYAIHNMSDEILVPKLRFDAFIGPSDITLQTAEQLSRFEPCGVGNPTPLFALCGAAIKKITPLSSGKHLKLDLSVGGACIQGLYFGMSVEDFEFKVGELADFAVTLDINEYRGIKSPQVIIRDMRKAGLKAGLMKQPQPSAT